MASPEEIGVPEGVTLEDTKAPTEIALSATDIDLAEVARRTEGRVSFSSNGQPNVSWGDYGGVSLSWESEYEYYGRKLHLIPGKRTLKLWRGEWGGRGMESAGLVMGKDFVAFVHPTESALLDLKDGELGAEIISAGTIKLVKGREGIFNPVFLEARDIANRNAEAINHPQV